MIALGVLVSVLAARPADEPFWALFDEVAALRQSDRLVEAFERLPRLEAAATSDVERAYALGERVYLFTVLGTPDRAAGPYRAMKEAFAALGPSAPVEAFFGELEYELPYRLAVDDFAGVVRRVDEARRDARWDSPEPSFDVGRLEIERQRALAMAAGARHGGVPPDEALTALRRLTDDLGYAGPEILLRVGTLALERGDAAGAAAARDAAAAQVEAWRAEGAASDLDELNLAVLCVRVALADGSSGGVDELAAARAALSEAWRRGLSKWAAADAEGGVGILHFDLRQDALSALVRATIALGEGAEAALAHVVETQEASALARALGVVGRSVAELRGAVLVGDDHVVLVLLPATLGGELFLLTTDGVVHHPLDAADVRSALDGAPRLPEAVTRRVAATRRVTFCAIGPLAGAPLERIVVTGDRPLLLTHAVDFVPSLPAAAALAERARSRSARTLDPGAPLVVSVAGPTPSAAAAARWEVVRRVPLDGLPWEAAVAAYPEERVVHRSGKDATRAALEDAAGAPVLQVFAHGVLDDRRVRPATLVLAPADASDDGLLSCAQAERSGGAHLVVLGACASAAGPYRGGDEAAADLAGAFLAGGAAAVVAADARIDAYETLDVVGRFHGHLAAGASPAEALRRARVERGGAPGDDGLRVLGAGQTPVFASPVARRLRVGGAARVAIVLLALALPALAVVAVRRRLGPP